MGFIVKGVKKLGKGAAKVVKGVVGFAGKVIGSIFGFGAKKPKAASPIQNLNKTLEPETNRKIVFGRMAAPLDVRFWEVYGSNGGQFDEVLALASHQIHSVNELYLEEKLAINAAGQIQAPFSGVLNRAIRLGAPGQTALSVGSGSLWDANSKMTGCAHMVLKWTVDEKKLPNGPPGRYTQVIDGALVYDPRRDSTRGGSGTHRIDNQSTWEYATLDPNGVPIGRNNALQALWYLIGWRVQNPITGEWVLTCGRGVNPEDINIDSFIAGANACEVAAYYTDMLLSTGDEHSENEDKITCEGLIGRLLDPGGLWTYYANVNDTANIAVELTDNDIVDGQSVSWNEFARMSEQFNQVSGKYINPSSITLYQPFPYATVRDAAYEASLGVKKRRTQDFDQVLDNVLAQRLARLKLNAGQYQGEFKANFNFRSIKAQGWSVVRYTSERFGWTKYFRVWRYELNMFTGVAMTLREIDPSIWSAGTTANMLDQALGSNVDPLSQYAVLNFTAQQTSVTGAGSYPIINDGVILTWTAPPVQVTQTEIRYRIVGASTWQYYPAVVRGSANTITILPLVRGTQYEINIRHISNYGVEGPWISINPFTAGNAGNVVTANAPVLGSIDPITGRILNPMMYNTSMLLNIQSTTNITISYTATANNVIVNIGPHQRSIAGVNGPVVLYYSSGSIVVPFDSYWIAYVDDPDLNGDFEAVYNYTNDTRNLLYPGRYQVASGVSPTSSGSGGASGPGGGGGGFYDNCVAYDSFMPNGLRAYQIKPGDLIEIVAEDGLSVSEIDVTNNYLAKADCVRLVSESGISVVVAKATPCASFRGYIEAYSAFGHKLPVKDENGFRWERIAKVEDVGIIDVAHISCHSNIYAAGEKNDGRFIFTHNIDNEIKPSKP